MQFRQTKASILYYLITPGDAVPLLPPSLSRRAPSSSLTFSDVFDADLNNGSAGALCDARSSAWISGARDTCGSGEEYCWMSCLPLPDDDGDGYVDCEEDTGAACVNNVILMLLLLSLMFMLLHNCCFCAHYCETVTMISRKLSRWCHCNSMYITFIYTLQVGDPCYDDSMDETCHWTCPVVTTTEAGATTGEGETTESSGGEGTAVERNDFCNGGADMLMGGFEVAGKEDNICVILFFQAWILVRDVPFIRI